MRAVRRWRIPSAEAVDTLEVLDDGGVPVYVWLFLAGLGFNMISGNAGVYGLPLGLDRPLLLLSVLLLALEQGSARPRFGAVHVVMGLTILWTLFSWISTGSITDSTKAFALSDRIVVPFLMFVVGPIIFCNPTRRLLLAKCAVVLGIYLGLTGIFELSHLNALVFPRQITNDSLGIGGNRARGPFLASEPYGMTVGLTFFMSGAVVALAPERRWRLWAGVSMVLSSVGVLLSLTRSAWIATLIGALIVGIWVPAFRRWVPVAVAALAAVIAGALALLPALRNQVTSRFDDSRSIDDRLNVSAAGFRIVRAHPLQGIGWGNFLDNSAVWVRQADSYPITNIAIEIHDVFLSRAAETGIPGAALWILTMVMGPVAAVFMPSRTREQFIWRLIAAAGIAIWLIPSLGSPNPYPLPNNLVWLLGGIAAGTWALVRPSRGTDGEGVTQ